MEFKMFLENEEVKSAFKPKLKLFGADAERVTTTEMQNVLSELRDLFQDLIPNMELVKSIDSKQDHGDIDILILSHPQLKEILYQRLGNRLISFSKNGNITSILFDSHKIKKKVHVDFISSSNIEDLEGKRVYYALNDVSAIIGIIGKKLHFKYGTEGIFKRFQDKKGIWHDIPISKNLYDGMKILGFDLSKYSNIKNHADIIEFMSSNPMVDSSFFGIRNMVSRDRRMLGARVGLDYLIDKLVNMNVHASIADEDHFFKLYFNQKYIEVEKAKLAINVQQYKISNKYNGQWVMSTFNLPPGQQIGIILKALSDNYGDNLESANEAEVIQFIKRLI